MTGENTPALSRKFVLEVTWTDCPDDVKRVVRDLWRHCELGNDDFYLRRSIDDMIESYQDWQKDDPTYDGPPFEPTMVDRWDRGLGDWKSRLLDVQPLIDYLRAQGVSDHEEVFIHYWW